MVNLLEETDWKRIENQMRIHWNWLRLEKDYKIVFQYLISWSGTENKTMEKNK